MKMKKRELISGKAKKPIATGLSPQWCGIAVGEQCLSESCTYSKNDWGLAADQPRATSTLAAVVLHEVNAPDSPDRWSRALDWSKLKLFKLSVVNTQPGLVQTMHHWSGPLVHSLISFLGLDIQFSKKLRQNTQIICQFGLQISKIPDHQDQ